MKGGVIMKYKPTAALLIIACVISLVEIIMILMNFKVPSILVIITIILLVTASLIDGIRTEKAKGLIYPLIVVYFLIGLPFWGNIISNETIYIGIVIVSFIITIIVVFYKAFATNESKKR